MLYKQVTKNFNKVNKTKQKQKQQAHLEMHFQEFPVIIPFYFFRSQM